MLFIESQASGEILSQIAILITMASSLHHDYEVVQVPTPVTWSSLPITKCD